MHTQIHTHTNENIHTYLHVTVSVSWAGITSSALELSRMGGVIEKPITRAEGANTATALDSCYTGLGQDQVVLTERRVCCRISATRRESEIRHDSPLFISFTSCAALRNSQTEKSLPSHRESRSSLLPPSEWPQRPFSLWFITNAFTSLTGAWIIWPV